MKSCHLRANLRKIKAEEIHDHYLGKRIRNGLIQLMGNKVQKTIVDRIKTSKYFAVILDCTHYQLDTCLLAPPILLECMSILLISLR